MPTYNYEYTRDDGTLVEFEAFRHMSARNEAFEVLDKEDGKTYIATRGRIEGAQVSPLVGADWKNSDLPPVHYGPEDVAKDQERRKGRKRTKS